MKNKELYILVDDVKAHLGNESNVTDEVIESCIKRYSNIACVESCYKTLPKEFYCYVVDATIESCQRIGHEGMASRNELGVSTSYSYKDIEESIRAKLKGKKNPRAFLGYWS